MIWRSLAFWLKNNIKYIYRLLLIILWLILYQYGHLTINRLILFIVIILFIFIFKFFLINWQYIYINKLDIIILFYLDIIKLIYIYIIIYLYVLIYYLSKFNFRFFNYIIWIINHIIINPVLGLISRLYDILQFWKSRSLIDIFFNRIYGVLISILFFTPIFNYLLIIFNYYNLYLYIYILWIIFSILEDYKKQISEYKYLKYFKYLVYLKLYKDISFLLMTRNDLSIFSFLIINNLNKLPNFFVKKSAFNLNYIHCIVIHNVKYIIIDYNEFLLSNKITNVKNNMFNNNILYSTFFKSFFIKTSSIISDIFKHLSNLEYLKFQNYTVLNKIELKKINELKIFIIYLLNLVLFFLFNIAKLIGMSNIEISNLLTYKINSDYFIKFNETILIKEINLKKINIYISNQDFETHKNMFQSMYLYLNIWNYCNQEDILYIDFDNNLLLKKYIEIFKKDVQKYINHLEIKDRYDVIIHNENLISMECEKVKNELIQNWLNQSLDLTSSNLYRKSYNDLNKLNEYIKSLI